MATAGSAKEYEFSSTDFRRIRSLIYKRAGISLADNKEEMVYSRISRRLRAYGYQDFRSYLDDLENGDLEDEWEEFTNALTTNLTSFFRESQHFPILAEHVKRKRGKGTFRVWCSASSTGEEPYSIAITLCEAFNSLHPNAEIIATDIDTNVLQTASSGIYSRKKVERLSVDRLKKFFLKGSGSQEGMVRARPELRKLITFHQMNLLEDKWRIQGPFDVIFCRNVMIYFDKATQAKIMAHFAPLLKPDGLLMVGHSENFTHLSKDFKLIGNTVYKLTKYLDASDDEIEAIINAKADKDDDSNDD